MPYKLLSIARNSNTSYIMSSPKEFWIKNMVCSRCLKVIKQELQELGVTVLSLELGRLLVEAPKKTSNEIVEAVTTVLHANDFEILFEFSTLKAFQCYKVRRKQRP